MYSLVTAPRGDVRVILLDLLRSARVEVRRWYLPPTEGAMMR